MILGINPFYVHVNSNFDFFVNVKSCFKSPVMRKKAKKLCMILLSERVQGTLKKDLYTAWQTHMPELVVKWKTSGEGLGQQQNWTFLYSTKKCILWKTNQ